VTAERLVALSIDLDGLDLYLGLYGLSNTLTEQARRAVPAKATERFAELCASLGMLGTLFVVGRDVIDGHGRDELKAAAKAGHELASHSFNHDYALSRRSADVIDADLSAAEQILSTLTGKRPVGFRAPGYTLSPVLSQRLAARNYLYDSSLLPSPPYYGAKAAVIGALAAVGRESRSILGPPAQLFRPRQPHRDEAGLLELPIAVVPGARVPFYGTVIVSAPDVVSAAMARAFPLDPLVVIELHGVDLIDASDGMPAELIAHQRNLGLPYSVKRRRIERVMRSLLRHRTGVTLAEAARRLGPGA
jgi:peptidoglycan/xylan/chitin deacetylase (PgdA/CDA1 family)